MAEQPYDLTPRGESEEGYYTSIQSESSGRTTSLQTPPGVDVRNTPNDNRTQPTGKRTQTNFCSNKVPFMKIGFVLIILLLVVNVILIILNITGTINKDQSTDESQTNGLSYEKTKLKTEQEMLKERIDEMQKKEEETQNKEIELMDEIKTLKSRVSTIEEKSLAGEVAFFVHLQAGDRTITDGSILIFDVIVTNYGDGYSADLAAFIAPVHGLYAFNLYFKTQSDVNSDLGIFVNSERVCFGVGAIHNQQGTCTAMVELQAEDVVNVKAMNGGVTLNGDHGGDSGAVNGFVGFLYLPL